MSSQVLAGETRKMDALGIALSALCAIHCLSVPLLLGVLPFASIGFIANHEFEWVMMGTIFVVAALSFVSGYRRHRRREVFLFLALGVGVFLFLRPFLSEAWHPLATLGGGLAFVAGHWKNWHWHRPACPAPCCSQGR